MMIHRAKGLWVRTRQTIAMERPGRLLPANLLISKLERPQQTWMWKMPLTHSSWLMRRGLKCTWISLTPISIRCRRGRDLLVPSKITNSSWTWPKLGKMQIKSHLSRQIEPPEPYHQRLARVRTPKIISRSWRRRKWTRLSWQISRSGSSIKKKILARTTFSTVKSSFILAPCPDQLKCIKAMSVCWARVGMKRPRIRFIIAYQVVIIEYRHVHLPLKATNPRVELIQLRRKEIKIRAVKVQGIRN